MPARTAERRCAAIAAELDIPQPFDFDEFLAMVETRRGKKIHLHPFRSGQGLPCGLWIGTDSADHVFHEEGTSGWHQMQIIMHELAHMLLGHEGTGAWDSMARLLAPDVSPTLVRLVLGRAAYDTIEERQAEILASLILARAVPAPRELAVGEGTAAMMNRLVQMWGNGRRTGQSSWVLPNYA